MTREARDDDFEIVVEGVGSFRFGRRTMRDEIKVQVEYARIIEGVQPTPWLAMVGGWLSALKVLTVRAPDGWDIDAMDPLDADTYAKLLKVHSALAEKEGSFRSGKGKTGEASGASAGGDV